MKDMKNRKTESMQDRLVHIEKSYETIYVTLISIIQATVFGYLIATFNEHHSDFTHLRIVLFVTTFLMIVIVWNQYVMASTAFKYIPRLFPDSVLPFALGFTEIVVIGQIFADLHLWCYSVALVMVTGWLALVNGYRNARHHPTNVVIFQRLGHWPKLSQILVLVISMLFALLGLVSYQYASNQPIQHIVACFFLVSMVVQLVTGAKYWELIIGGFREEME